MLSSLVELATSRVTLTLAVGAVLYGLYAIYRIYADQYERYGKFVDSLPGLSKLPIVGTTHWTPRERKDLPKLIQTIVEKWGKEGLTRQWLGPTPMVNFFHPETVRPILNASRAHITKSFVYDALSKWLGTGLLIADGEKWKNRRNLITPTFHFDVLKSFYEIMDEQSDVFVRCLEERSRNGQVFDIFEPITLAALDIICETAMGYKLNAQGTSKANNAYVKAVYRISHNIVWRVERFYLQNDFLFSLTSKGKEFRDDIQTLQDFTDKVVASRRQYLQETSKSQPHETETGVDEFGKKKKGQRPAFLDILLTATDASTGQPLSRQDIQEEVDTFMFEGHDTTSASIAWTMQLIGRHPEVQKRLHDEIDQLIAAKVEQHGLPPDGRRVSFTVEDLSKLTYLEMVIKESLRLYPSVPFVSRTLTEDVEIAGKVFPKGLTVGISVWALHRNPHVWPDPLRFDPERFSPENSRDRHPFAYIPFSAGSRNCVGQKFAQQEEKLLIAKVLRDFQIEAVKDQIDSIAELILRPAGGVPVRLTKRY